MPIRRIQQIDASSGASPAKVVNAEVQLYPITWGRLNKVLGISYETSHRYAEKGLSFLRTQRIDNDDQLWQFCAVYLWCSKGSGGGRGNPFTPAAFADFRLDKNSNVSRQQIIQHLSEAQIDADQIEELFNQTRDRIKNRT